MIDHKIVVGLSTLYKKGGSWFTAEPVPGARGILEHLISTSSLIAMIIEASSGLLDPLLPDEYITIGKKIELSNVSPALLDSTVTIKVKVVDVSDNRIYLEVTGEDEFGEICKGKYERVIVNKGDLLNSAYERAEKNA